MHSSIVLHIHESNQLYLHHCKIWLYQQRLSECVSALIHCFIGWQPFDFTLYVREKRPPADKISNSAHCCLLWMRRSPGAWTHLPWPHSLGNLPTSNVCLAGVSFIHFTLFTIKQNHRPVKVQPVDFPLKSVGDQCKEGRGWIHAHPGSNRGF